MKAIHETTVAGCFRVVVKAPASDPHQVLTVSHAIADYAGAEEQAKAMAKQVIGTNVEIVQVVGVLRAVPQVFEVVTP